MLKSYSGPVPCVRYYAIPISPLGYGRLSQKALQLLVHEFQCSLCSYIIRHIASPENVELYDGISARHSRSGRNSAPDYDRNPCDTNSLTWVDRHTLRSCIVTSMVHIYFGENVFCLSSWLRLVCHLTLVSSMRDNSVIATSC